jgi:hypothetical protein
MQASDGYFPPMFVQMVAIGEQTGKLDEVLKRLGEHYEHLAVMRRNFLIGIAWPAFELVFAVLVIGAVIFITGIIGAASGSAPQHGRGDYVVLLLRICRRGNRAIRACAHSRVVGPAANVDGDASSGAWQMPGVAGVIATDVVAGNCAG